MHKTEWETLCTPSIYIHYPIVYHVITARGTAPSGINRQEVERMDCMTQAELVVWLATLAELIESKASTGAEAAEIIREKISQLK